MLTDLDHSYGHRYGDGDHSGIRCPECGSSRVLISRGGVDDSGGEWVACCRDCGETSEAGFSAREAANKWEEF
jgi:transcription elongation factor Elf1